VDVLFLHNPPQKLAKEAGVWHALAELQGEGMVRFFGVSARTANDARAYLRAADGDPPDRRFGDVIQVAYNLLDQEAAATGVFVEAHRQDWGVVSRVPLASGMLGGRYRAGHYFPPEDFRATWSRERIDATIARVDELRFLSRPGRSLAQTAIAFCLSQDAVSTVISGARNPEQVEENVAAIESAPLPPEEVRAVYETSGQ
jgi:aryl-alcohol dehydrogenase-like predicted oxidoreductase